ncbi:MAG: hypothetical protein J2P41_17070, partial [Blastocatellia bacterium]|nr:hypothetical protein [Blastocatellia bacterium]
RQNELLDRGILIMLGTGEIVIILVILFFFMLVPIVVGLYFIKLYFWNRKPCPHCAEKIKEAAKVCRFCGRDVINT